MPGLKTMHDIRTLRSVASHAMPTSEGAMFLQLHRLACEKLRLEQEVEMWQRKKARIEKRLGEIEQQMEHLRQVCPNVTIKSQVSTPKKTLRQVPVEY